MKLDSKYFDSIRISGVRSRKGPETKPTSQVCQWSGCSKRGLYKAPKGRDREGQYYYFCREHVTEYNKSYNYFAGMNECEVEDYQKSASLGHRPTWSMGVSATAAAAWEDLRDSLDKGQVHDPLHILNAIRGKRRAAGTQSKEPQRRIVQKVGRKYLLALNLDENATPEEIRMQFKALVKLHHPDLNGGDRSSEERFREVIDAYNYLKQAGLC
jgi:hypothetical protein